MPVPRDVPYRDGNCIQLSFLKSTFHYCDANFFYDLSSSAAKTPKPPGNHCLNINTATKMEQERGQDD